MYDYQKFAILYVDDEEKSLKYFTRAFSERFRILTAPSAKEGLALLEQHSDDIGILMTDQRMPGEKGIWLLERARQLRPRIVRILATAYSDMDAAIAAVNTGAVYKFITKPWDPPQLENTLMRGMEFFIVQRERDELLKEKMSVLHNMMIADRMVSLGLLASGLSHHIRNSLVAVKTFLDLAPSKLQEEKMDVEGLRNPDFWKEYYQNVQTQVSKINNMLGELWSASDSASEGFHDQVSLREIVAAAVAVHQQGATEKNITFENLVSDALPKLNVDKPKFSRLFEMLFKDEIVSLPAGSKVTISAEAANGSEVRVQIRDNGPGLPKEALRLIFDPFALRSDTPTEYGISLMACYFIAHHHGGRIDAQSSDAGTVFSLCLPVNPDQKQLNQDENQFLQKVLLNDSIWEKLISTD